MKCPTCGGEDHGVRKTVTTGDTVRRTRQCGRCGYRWVTVEIPAEVHKRSTKALELLDMAGAIAPGAAIATERAHDPVTHHEVQVRVPPILKFGKG